MLQQEALFFVIQISCALGEVNYEHNAPKDKVSLDKPALAWAKCKGKVLCVFVWRECGGEDESSEHQGIIL